jgi:LmbE family N-acetylglucosaminyl deacetylase
LSTTLRTPQGGLGQLVDGRSLLVVTAHPDDESLAFGGTLARCASTGGATSVLCLTHGELGWAGGPPRPDFIPELARIRGAELRAAAAILDVGHVRLLDFPDSRLSELSYAPMVSAIQEAILVDRPEIVATFGHDGLYWHQDHIVAHYTVTQAIESLPARSRPDLVYGVLQKGMMRELLTVVAAPGTPPEGLEIWGLTPDAFGLHAAAPTHAIDVRAFVPRKLSALRCHRSQLGPESPFVRLSDADAVRLLGTEYYHRAFHAPISPSTS